VALADLGCGDGPLFPVLARLGHVSPRKPCWAVDLEAERLARVSARVPFVKTVVAPADLVLAIPDGSLDWVLSTMVMEHVSDERAYLAEIARILRPGGRCYLTTVYKKTWAWYFRKRDGQSVLDTSHLREYTDLHAFEELLMEEGRFRRLVALELEPLWFPLLDPLLFRVAGRLASPSALRMVRLLRTVKVPILGYYSLNVVLER
jgi:ubiquinone/menaquinone biosynthesis C-methylase UbiE